MDTEKNNTQKKYSSFSDLLDFLIKLSLKIRRNFILFLIIWGVIIAIGLVYIFSLTEQFASKAIILPSEGNSGNSTMSALLASSGMPLDFFRSSESETNYPVVAKSNTILDDVLKQNYKDGTVLEYFLSEREKSEFNIQSVKRQIKSKLRLDLDPRSRVFVVEYMDKDAEFAAHFVNMILKCMDNYYKEQYVTKSLYQKELLEDRYQEVSDSLLKAEEQLVEFKKNNRLIIDSPARQMDLSRYSREVEKYSLLYLQLSKQLELAKIKEIGDREVLNVLEYASASKFRAKPGSRLNLLIAVIFIGFFISSFWLYNKNSIVSFIKEYLLILSNDGKDDKKIKKNEN